MGQLWETLRADVDRIVKQDRWEITDGGSVPSPEDIGLGNRGVNLDAVVLYADLVESTKLVDQYEPQFAAEVYKCYLSCACKIIKRLGGVIVGFDGDRVMAIYLGDAKETDALKTALQINAAVGKIINPTLLQQYPQKSYSLRQVVGVDSGKLLVAKTGVRGDNDLVWVGCAANYAAKLCDLREGSYASWCTKAVYDVADDSAKLCDGNPMWEARLWTAQANRSIYRSHWLWEEF